jgi:hypothetical protein
VMTDMYLMRYVQSVLNASSPLLTLLFPCYKAKGLREIWVVIEEIAQEAFGSRTHDGMYVLMSICTGLNTLFFVHYFVSSY